MNVMLDITGPPNLEIMISQDGKTVWINIAGSCVFHATRIPALLVSDYRDNHEGEMK